MASIKNFIKRTLIAAIKLYQFGISCFLGNCCRFEPTCSRYALEAIHQCGCLKGGFLSIKRVFSCHPWHPGGYDPVPKKE